MQIIQFPATLFEHYTQDDGIKSGVTLSKSIPTLSGSDASKGVDEKISNRISNIEYRIMNDEVLRQIDRAVYELYGLTEEEIRVVEGDPSTPSLAFSGFSRSG